jgi:prevent-host-death family protein
LLDLTKDIQSLTTFRPRSGDFMKQLKKTKRPVVLTVKGKAAAIVQDAEAYQGPLDIAASADAEEGFRAGGSLTLLTDALVRRERSSTIFAAKHNIPR